MYTSTSRSTTSTVLTTWCVAAIYNSIGSLIFGAAKIGLLAKTAFISSNPAASVHLKLSIRRSSLYNGNAFSPNLEINRLKAAMHPASFWTCFKSVGVANCDKARILVGFASIPLLEMMKLSNFPEGTLKTHFSGLRLMSYVRRLSNISLKSSIRVSTCLVFMTMSSTYASTVLPICFSRHV